VEAFFSAVHHFTVVRIDRVASRPIDSSTLAWLPVVGILSALIVISFYLPLATLYLPLDAAIILGLVAVSWLRGFKPENDFCQLCDLLSGRRKRFTTRSFLGVPGATCLLLGMLLKYVILRQFYLFESVRLLAFGTIVSFIAPLFRPAHGHRWLAILGVVWLIITAIVVFSGSKTVSFTGLLLACRGPALAFALIYLCVRSTFSILEKAAPPNVASFPAELVAYIAFLTVRYHFI
jgi:hypothetical protein